MAMIHIWRDGSRILMQCGGTPDQDADEHIADIIPDSSDASDVSKALEEAKTDEKFDRWVSVGWY